MLKVLIVKMSSLGDIVQTFPVLDYLKGCDPDVQVDWVVECPFAELVIAHPHVTRVLCVQTKKWRSQWSKLLTWQEMRRFRRELRSQRYDIVLDLQGNTKSAIATAHSRSHLKVGFGYPSVREWPNLLVTHKRFVPPSHRNMRDDYLFIAQQALETLNPGVTPNGTQEVQLELTPQQIDVLNPLMQALKSISFIKIMVCPGSQWPNKQLSQETLLSFLQAMSKRLTAHFLWIWGNESEKILVQQLASHFSHQSLIVDKLPLPVLQHLMGAVDLVIAMDSLPLHLASTTATPSYGIFGPTSANKLRPKGEQHGAFQGSCPYHQAFEKQCRLLRTCSTGACLKEVEGQRLFEHFFAWWTS